MSLEIIAGLFVAILGGGHIWVWMTNRGKHQVDLITLGQSIAAATIVSMKQERAEMTQRIDALEDQITGLKGQLDALLNHAEVLEKTLRERGIEHPARPKVRVSR